MRRAAKRDANHSALVAELRKRGYAVSDFGGIGGGVPDLYVSQHGIGLWLEVKTPGATKPAGKLRAQTRQRQQDWAQKHDGCVLLVEAIQEVEDAFVRLLGDRPPFD